MPAYGAFTLNGLRHSTLPFDIEFLTHVLMWCRAEQIRSCNSSVLTEKATVIFIETMQLVKSILIPAVWFASCPSLPLRYSPAHALTGNRQETEIMFILPMYWLVLDHLDLSLIDDHLLNNTQVLFYLKLFYWNFGLYWHLSPFYGVQWIALPAKYLLLCGDDSKVGVNSWVNRNITT